MTRWGQTGELFGLSTIVVVSLLKLCECGAEKEGLAEKCQRR